MGGGQGWNKGLRWKGLVKKMAKDVDVDVGEEKSRDEDERAVSTWNFPGTGNDWAQHPWLDRGEAIAARLD